LMLPLIAGPALADLLHLPLGHPISRNWLGYIFWGSAVSGGLFGLLGGYLADRFGRKRVLVWSILVYSLSPLAAAFSTSAGMLFFFRCTTFIGVCVEFPAAIAWLAELFPEPKRRERILGWTQAFASVGGLVVTGANALCVQYANSLPAIHGGHAAWRYTLITGLIPGLLLLMLLPLLPESPVWLEKRKQGTLKRPEFWELFQPALRRTTLVTTILFACGFGAAFGTLQLAPAQMVPGLPQVAEATKTRQTIEKQEAPLMKQLAALPPGSPERKTIEAQLAPLRGKKAPAMKQIQQAATKVQFFQEMGGLAGRCLLALLVTVIASRVTLLRMFLVPGVIIVPLVYFYPARTDLELLKWGVFVAGMLTIGQFSFWGNYLPRVYPVHLRGTGESFAANVGGRMIGASAGYVTTNLIAPHLPYQSTFAQVAVGGAIMALFVYALGLLLTFWLPEPEKELTIEN